MKERAAPRKHGAGAKEQISRLAPKEHDPGRGLSGALRFGAFWPSFHTDQDAQGYI